MQDTQLCLREVPIYVRGVLPATILTTRKHSISNTHRTINALRGEISLMFLPQSRQTIQDNMTRAMILTFGIVNQVGRMVCVLFLRSKEAFNGPNKLILQGLPELSRLGTLHRYFLLGTNRVVIRLYRPGGITVYGARRVGMEHAIVVGR